MKSITLGIIEDDPLIQDSLNAYFTAQLNTQIILASTSVEAFLDELSNTFEETDVIFKALSNGACSYVSKRVSLEKISEAVTVVREGGSYMSPSIARKIANFYMPKTENKSVLTDRQMEIVNGIVSGKSYKVIAEDLFVSINTVRSHIKNIYNILEINSKAELIKKSFDREL